jgi:hypothetical protein
MIEELTISQIAATELRSLRARSGVRMDPQSHGSRKSIDVQ